MRNPVDLNNLPVDDHFISSSSWDWEHIISKQQPLDHHHHDSSSSPAASSGMKKKYRSSSKLDESERSSGGKKKVYECRFCSLKFPKSQALGGHMNRHRQERETETLNQARQLVFSTTTTHHHHMLTPAHPPHPHQHQHQLGGQPVVHRGGYHYAAAAGFNMMMGATTSTTVYPTTLFSSAATSITTCTCILPPSPPPPQLHQHMYTSSPSRLLSSNACNLSQYPNSLQQLTNHDYFCVSSNIHNSASRT